MKSYRARLLSTAVVSVGMAVGAVGAASLTGTAYAACKPAACACNPCKPECVCNPCKPACGACSPCKPACGACNPCKPACGACNPCKPKKACGACNPKPKSN